MKTTFNDGIGSRGIRHMNLLLARVGEKDLLFQFGGEPIPGVARIAAKSYEKNGKWSHTTWEVELSEGIEGFSWSQDWEEGEYLGSSWDQTIGRVQAAARSLTSPPSREAVERFVRVTFKPELIARLDEAEGVLRLPAGPILEEILAAQEERAAASREFEEVKEEITRLEQAEADRLAAAAMRERASKARAAMSRGASLADLKALLG